MDWLKKWGFEEFPKLHAMRILLIFKLVVAFFVGCSGKKVVYNKKNDGYREKIIYMHSNDCRQLFYFAYLNGSLKKEITMNDCPKKIVITKREQFGIENQYSMVAVSDTSNCLFKSLDYEFLPEFCNSLIKQTFVSVANDDNKAMLLMYKVIQKKTENGYPLHHSDIDKIIGWIKISY